jgi:hypothetical protein
MGNYLQCHIPFNNYARGNTLVQTIPTPPHLLHHIAINRVTDDDIMIERLNTQLTSSSTSNRTLLTMLVAEQQRSIAQTASFLAAALERTTASASSSPTTIDTSGINVTMDDPFAAPGSSSSISSALPSLHVVVPSSGASSPINGHRSSASTSRHNSYDADAGG